MTNSLSLLWANSAISEQNAKPYIAVDFGLKPPLDSVIVVKICFSICTMTLQGSLYWGNRKIYLPAFITVNLLVGCCGNRKRCSQQEVQLANSTSLRIIACTLDNWRSYHSLLLIWICNTVPLHFCNFCKVYFFHVICNLIISQVTRWV